MSTEEVKALVEELRCMAKSDPVELPFTLVNKLLLLDAADAIEEMQAAEPTEKQTI